MSIDLPLTVRLKTSRRDSDITAQVGDVSFAKAVPGGFTTCQLTLNRPLSFQPDDIEYFATLYVYDGRNGETIWEGRLEDPGRGAGDEGEVWQLNALGPKTHAQDEAFPVIYVDTALERWVRSLYSTSQARTETGEIDDETPALIVRAEEGQTVSATWLGDWIYRTLWYCGQKIARIRCDFVCDGSSSLYKTQIVTRIGSGAAAVVTDQVWSTSPTVAAANLGSAGWGSGHNVASLRGRRITSSATAPDTVVLNMYNVAIRGTLYTRDGFENLSTSDYTTNTVTPDEVVADLLGRKLSKYDGINASIQTSGVAIDQLAYPDGTTAGDILEDLALYDPQYYWAAWETNSLTGKNRFEYTPWPTIVRYEADISDGFDSPASASELYNAVRVRWRDSKNRVRSTVRTQTVQDLTDNGLTRTAHLDISDEIGSLGNANRIGDNFLIEHQFPPNAGTLTVARRILDLGSGRMVMPWEIMPGHLIRVRGVQPRTDALNPADRDGVTIFRVISSSFNTQNATAVLELDSYVRSIQRTMSRDYRTIAKHVLRRRPK